MRLTCPNCKAQYEVDDRVIPQGGRDVQCSACGTTWFQYPAEVALRMRAADLDDDDDGSEAGSAGGRPSAGGAAPAEARIDRTVLEVLRQEAEREMAERRRQAPPVETQPDLGLVSRPRGRAAQAGSGMPVSAQPGRAEAPAPPEAAASRRSLLPDIEEVSTRLDSNRGPRAPAAEGDEPATAPDRTGRGRDFRRGLSAVVLVVAILSGLYLLAPVAADLVPPLAGPLAGYVALVDQLRIWAATWIGG